MEPYCNMNNTSGRYCYGQMPMNQGCGQRNVSPDPRRVPRGGSSDMEVSCVCKVTPGKSCHKNDPMEKLGPRFPIAMAYVPWQQWGELYDPDCALKQGTVFKELNKIFCGVRC